MKRILLHGILAEKFGKEFRLDVLSCAEATHAIACQLPAFKLFMLKAEQNGMRFAVFIDDKNIGADEIENATAANTIHIVPKIMGSGGKAFAWLQVIAGAALIGFSGGLGSANGLAMIGAGVGLMIGGAASLLMPNPDLGTQDADGNRANYGFGGAVTTTAQNNPVPIGIGPRMWGGAIASAGIYTEDNQ